MQQKDNPMVVDCVPDKSAGFATNPVKKKTPNSPVVSDLHEPDCPVISNLKSKVRLSFIELLDKYKKHEAIQKKRDCPIKKKERPSTEHKRGTESSITT